MSDSHNRHNEIDMPSGDILIHCGDFTNNKTERFNNIPKDLDTSTTHGPLYGINA